MCREEERGRTGPRVGEVRGKGTGPRERRQREGGRTRRAKIGRGLREEESQERERAKRGRGPREGEGKERERAKKGRGRG